MSTDKNTPATPGNPRTGRVGRQQQLPLRTAVQIAWQNIRVRLGRSLLVTSGIVLAITFLTYILYADALAQAVIQHGSKELLETLSREGVVLMQGEDAIIQTRWMMGVALLVSFIGILNAMLLSVTERFREIGTMKCLGALDGLIVKLFLLESLFQGIVGTLAGLVLGIALTLIEGMGMYGGAMWELLPGAAWLRLAGWCALAGVGLTVCGALYPARVAAKMEPVEALRSEV